MFLTGMAGLSPSARWRQQGQPLFLQQSRRFTPLPKVSLSFSVTLASLMVPEWCHLGTDAQEEQLRGARIGGRGADEKTRIGGML